MASIAAIPVTISPEAAAHVAELGLQHVFEQILDRTRQTLPGLVSLRVTLEYIHDLEEECVLLEAACSDYQAARPAEDAWGLWRLTEIPPRIGLHFGLLVVPEDNDAGQGVS